MTGKKNDTRVQYTKARLKGALMRILHEKPIAQVSVRELCDEAGLNRGTFYLHYSVPNDVLQEIEQDFMDENFGHFSPYLEDREHSTVQLGTVFQSMMGNKETLQILLGKNGMPQFRERLKEVARASVLADWKRDFPDYSESDLDFVYSFLFAGATEVILEWFNGEHEMTAEDFARRLDRLGHYCHLAIAKF